MIGLVRLDDGILLDLSPLIVRLQREGESACTTCLRAVVVNGAPCPKRREYLAGAPAGTRVVQCPHHIAMTATVGVDL